MTKNKNYFNLFYSYGAPALFFVSLLLFYPLQFLRIFIQVPDYELLQVINLSTLSMLSIALVVPRLNILRDFILSDKKLTICFVTLLLIAIYHFTSIPLYNMESFFAECIWLTVPLFAAVYYRELIRFVPIGFLILWGFNFFVALREIIFLQLLRGVTGNWNWQACLLTLTTPVIVFWLWRSGRKWLQDIALLILAISTLLFLASNSRGAVLALVIVSALFIFCKYHRLLPRRIINRGIVLITGCFLLVSLIVLFDAVKLPAGGVRGYLWRGGLALISDYPVAGVGTQMYENNFTKYIPREYYLEHFAASRNTHPHNHILYIAGAFGLLGLFAWLGLLFFPVVNAASRLRRHFHWLPGCLLFSFLIMLIHSMLDLTFFAWPTNIIGLLILGLLWGMLIRREYLKRLPMVCSVLGWGIAAFLLGAVCTISYREFRANVPCRNGMVYLQMQSPANALNCFNESIAVRPDKTSVYRAARVALYDNKKPQLSIKYLNIMPLLGADNYLHTNEMTGKCLWLNGNPVKARDYFYREVEVYPLAVRGWFYVAQIERNLGNQSAAAKAEKMLLEVLKLKGLTPRYIPLLLKNEYWDLNPKKIPSEVLMINGIPKGK